MKVNTLFFVAILVLSWTMIPGISYGQLTTYRFEQLDSLQKEDQRTVVAFIHTDWCKYCKAMQNTSFKNKHIVELINKHFYLVDLDAEEKRSIRVHGHTFHYRPTGNNTGVHQLAEQLGTFEGKLSYPSLCFLNAENEIIYQHYGFIDSDALEKLLERLK